MMMILKRRFGVFNGENGEMIEILEGRHEIERISCPYGCPGMPWLVLKGTLIGSTEVHWNSLVNGFWDLVVIEN